MNRVPCCGFRRPLRIVQIAPYYFPSIGGVEKVVRYTAEELVRRGHEVTVLVSDRDHFGRLHPRVGARERIHGVEVVRLHSAFHVGHMNLLPGLLRALQEKPWDIVHAHVYRHPSSDLAILWAGLHSMATVLTGHGPFFPKRSIGSGKYRAYALYDATLGPMILKRTRVITALTRVEKKRYLAMKASQSQVKVIPNAADDACFQPVAGTALQKIRTSGTGSNLLFLGSLTPFKRPDLLVRALPKILREVQDVSLRLVGPDEGMAQQVLNLARELGVAKRVHWIGTLTGPSKQAAIEAADCLVLPSDEEPFGIVLIEAMARGKPVIATDADGPRELVRDQENGLLVPRGDAENLARAAICLLTQPEMRSRMGIRAKQIAQAEYSVPCVVDQVEALYYELLGVDEPGTIGRRRATVDRT